MSSKRLDCTGDLEANDPPKPSENGTENPSSNTSSTSEDLVREELKSQEKLFQWFTGIRQDLRGRLPLYADDWGRPKNFFTVLNATVFAFVIQLIPGLIFAELLNRLTKGHLATAEVLLSTAIVGVLYAVFAGQPLVLIGITGPMAILLGASYGLTETFNAEYFPFFFWTCMWAGMMHVFASVIGLVSLVWKVTPFTSQIFEFFSAITFMYSALHELIKPLKLRHADNLQDRGAEYANFIVGMVTFYVAWTLHFAERWNLFGRQFRVFLTSYNTLIACSIATAFSYVPGVNQKNNGFGGIERVDVTAPWDWQPTWDRPWVTNPLQGIDSRGIFGAMIPAFMLFLLFTIDHNVSSILTQNPKFNLKKPPAYHWDFFVLGVTFIPCAILGLPPGNGLLPQAPFHSRALCTRKYEKDSNGVTHEIVLHCEEQRWSALGQAILIFVSLSLFQIISCIPRGTLFGLLLYVGVSLLHGNEVWERVLLCFVDEKSRPQIAVVKHIKEWRNTVCYTLLQVVVSVFIFAVAQFASVGYIYPALLAALVPFRSYVLPNFFSAEDLKFLDPSAETEGDYLEEQREVRRAERSQSFDVDDIYFANRAAFRGSAPA